MRALSRAGPAVLSAALILIGFTAVTVQIVLMRELMVVFYGNELTVGLMLASWLLWTAAGSGLVGKLKVWPSRPERLLAVLQASVAAAFPLSLLATRAGRQLFHPVPGEVLAPGQMLLITNGVLAPFCVLSGWLFAAGSKAQAHAARTPTGWATGQVYVLEAIGWGAGGLAAGLVLIRALTSFQIAWIVSGLNLLAAAWLALFGWPRRAAIAVLALLLWPAFDAAGQLDRLSRGWLWRGFQLLEVRNSVYGNLAVVQTEGSRTLYESGVAVGTAPDPAAAEEAVHYALLQHPCPQRLLLIGGGWNGSLREALRHPTLRQVDYVELDPTILALAARWFAEQWRAASSDARVQVHAIDGRLYLKKAPGPFDVIIVNLPQPETALLNRFYTLEFFREAARKLSSNGIIALRLPAAENYLSPELAQLLCSVYSTLKQVFAGVAVLPGDTVHFFAAKDPESLVRDSPALAARLEQRGVQTLYVRDYYFRFRLMPARLQALESRLNAEQARLNSDFSPASYYYGLTRWGAQFNLRYRDLLERAAGTGFAYAAAMIFAVSAALGWLAWRRGAAAVAGVATGAMGLTLMAVQVMLLVGFQVLYGYVYHQLSLVIAAFMAGMALGSRYALGRTESSDPQRLAVLQIAALVAALLIYGCFQALKGVSGSASLWAVSYLVFPGLAFGAGWMGGSQFPVASRLYFARHRMGGPGAIYAFDLAGACVGALVTSAYLLPVFGFFKTACLLALLNLPPALAALRLAVRR